MCTIIIVLTISGIIILYKYFICVICINYLNYMLLYYVLNCCIWLSPLINKYKYIHSHKKKKKSYQQ